MRLWRGLAAAWRGRQARRAGVQRAAGVGGRGSSATPSWFAPTWVQGWRCGCCDKLGVQVGLLCNGWRGQEGVDSLWQQDQTGGRQSARAPNTPCWPLTSLSDPRKVRTAQVWGLLGGRCRRLPRTPAVQEGRPSLGQSGAQQEGQGQAEHQPSCQKGRSLQVSARPGVQQGRVHGFGSQQGVQQGQGLGRRFRVHMATPPPLAASSLEPLLLLPVHLSSYTPLKTSKSAQGLDIGCEGQQIMTRSSWHE